MQTVKKNLCASWESNPGPLDQKPPVLPTPARRAYHGNALAVAAAVCGDARAHFAWTSRRVSRRRQEQ